MAANRPGRKSSFFNELIHERKNLAAAIIIGAGASSLLVNVLLSIACHASVSGQRRVWPDRRRAVPHKAVMVRP
jgi:hypothetical protein